MRSLTLLALAAIGGGWSADEALAQPGYGPGYGYRYSGYPLVVPNYIPAPANPYDSFPAYRYSNYYVLPTSRLYTYPSYNYSYPAYSYGRPTWYGGRNYGHGYRRY